MRITRKLINRRFESLLKENSKMMYEV